MRRFIGRAARRLLRMIPPHIFEQVLGSLAVYYAFALSARTGLQFLFTLERRLYKYQGKLAIEYGQGIHPKHRHLSYHDFFVDHISPSDRVLDIGCGNGALSYDIAERAGARVYGIDLDEKNIRRAKELHHHDRVVYVVGNALQDLPHESFNVIVLSNVLEHIEDRVGLLQLLLHQCKPASVLIRVPCYERDWRVPLQDELGLDYRLDPTHYIEYTRQQFIHEMAQANLVIDDLISTWGELWASLRFGGRNTWESKSKKV